MSEPKPTAASLDPAVAEASRRRRSIALAVALAGFVGLVFLITIARLDGGDVAQRSWPQGAPR